jgi:hypothetical protein
MNSRNEVLLHSEVPRSGRTEYPRDAAMACFGGAVVRLLLARASLGTVVGEK